MGRKAPKDCPPPPVQRIVKVSSSRLFPYSRVMSEPNMVPTARSVELTARESVFFCPFFRALPIFDSRTDWSTVFSSSKSYTSAGSKWVLYAPPA